MPITDVNAVLQAVAPTKTGQVIVTGPSDAQNIVYKGLATAVSDGASTTFVLNWVDGTETLPFTPSGVVIFRCGGDEATDIYAVRAYSITNVHCTVKISGAGTITKTFIFAVLLLK